MSGEEVSRVFPIGGVARFGIYCEINAWVDLVSTIMASLIIMPLKEKGLGTIGPNSKANPTSVLFQMTAEE